MDKATFESLDIKDQVEYMNRAIEAGGTFTGTCKKIGIPKSTYSGRFEKAGYVKDADTKMYYYKSNGQVIIKNKNEIKIKKEAPVAGGPSTEEYNSLLTVISELKNIVGGMDGKLEEVYSWYELQNNINVIEPVEFKVEKFEGEAINRTYKIYEPLKIEFEEFCKKHKQYKVQDILSKFIKEGLERYK